jgi:hypothetical protein
MLKRVYSTCSNIRIKRLKPSPKKREIAFIIGLRSVKNVKDSESIGNDCVNNTFRLTNYYDFIIILTKV